MDGGNFVFLGTFTGITLALFMHEYSQKRLDKLEEAMRKVERGLTIK
jgi:HAMP domain-containing protein